MSENLQLQLLSDSDDESENKEYEENEELKRETLPSNVSSTGTSGGDDIYESLGDKDDENDDSVGSGTTIKNFFVGIGKFLYEYPIGTLFVLILCCLSLVVMLFDPLARASGSVLGILTAVMGLGLVLASCSVGGGILLASLALIAFLGVALVSVNIGVRVATSKFFALIKRCAPQWMRKAFSGVALPDLPASFVKACSKIFKNFLGPFGAIIKAGATTLSLVVLVSPLGLAAITPGGIVFISIAGLALFLMYIGRDGATFGDPEKNNGETYWQSFVRKLTNAEKLRQASFKKFRKSRGGFLYGLVRYFIPLFLPIFASVCMALSYVIGFEMAISFLGLTMPFYAAIGLAIAAGLAIFFVSFALDGLVLWFNMSYKIYGWCGMYKEVKDSNGQVLDEKDVQAITPQLVEKAFKQDQENQGGFPGILKNMILGKRGLEFIGPVLALLVGILCAVVKALKTWVGVIVTLGILPTLLPIGILFSAKLILVIATLCAVSVLLTCFLRKGFHFLQLYSASRGEMSGKVEKGKEAKWEPLKLLTTACFLVLGPELKKGWKELKDTEEAQQSEVAEPPGGGNVNSVTADELSGADEDYESSVDGDNDIIKLDQQIELLKSKAQPQGSIQTGQTGITGNNNV